MTTTTTQSTINENLDKYLFKDKTLSIRARRLWLATEEDSNWQLTLVGYRSRASFTITSVNSGLETPTLFSQLSPIFDAKKHAVIPLKNMPHVTYKTILEEKGDDKSTVVVLYAVTLPHKTVLSKAVVEESLFETIRKELDVMVASLSIE